MRGKRKQNTEIAYSMPPICRAVLHVKSSANAWWMDQFKMFLLYFAFSFDASIAQACREAGITVKQYKYFRKLHPAIDDVRSGLRLLLFMRAHKTVITGILAGDARLAMKYLAWRRPEEFGPSPKNVSVCEEEDSSASAPRSRVEMLMQEVISSMNQPQ